MKTIYFDCTHCEAKRFVSVVDVEPFYIICQCPVCRTRITINKKRFKPVNKLAM